ncbi:uncharacterized protein N7500_008294 [Penicillium coprophilum]|uniref:uncharacterized protein n=1 Tax=Penicillium coprophilum TaxID=36646 RepID=UPI0023A1A254|nr:uncharacterized protein N7500_008294 [Penicillium coprophilum]KAJ5158643.1 hypothetical protein N7500_008294 [Penicillium coprophilum]
MELIFESAHQNNPLRIPYILMSKAKGKTLDTYWGGINIPPRPDSLEIHKVMFQLGHIAWKLAQVRFTKIGSLFEQNGFFVIGECLSKAHILHQRHCLSGIVRGPYANERELYISLIALLIKHACNLPLLEHCFAAPAPSKEDYPNKHQWHDARDLWNDFLNVRKKTDGAANRVDYVIAGQARSFLIPQYASKWSGVTTSPASFPLCHSDLTTNNIFVDDEYNITCIIDWAFTTTVPLPLLLLPPGLPQS